MSETLEEMQERHEKEIETLLFEEKIKTQLPDINGLKWSVHVYELYGEAFSVKLEHSFYDYAGKKPQPNLDTIRKAWKHFPGITLNIVDEGSKAVMSERYMNSLHEEKKENWNSETLISPFYVEVNAFQHQTMEFNWNSVMKIDDKEYEFGIEIILPLTTEFGYFSIQHRSQQSDIIIRCDFITNHNNTIQDDDERVHAKIGRKIKFASGSRTTPNRFLIFWHDNRPQKPCSLVTLIDHIEREYE